MKKLLMLLIMIFGLSVIFTACGGASEEAADEDTEEAADAEGEEAPAQE